MIRSGLVLVAVSPVMFAASLWMQSWTLYALFGIALNLGFVLILRAWFKTPTGDGAWPFTPADGPPPTRWAPEVAFWLRWSAWLTFSILAAGALVWLLTSNGLIGFNPFLGTVMIWCGFIATVGWPFLFPLAVWNAVIQTSWGTDFAPIQAFVPSRLRERRARFYSKWPNVDGWG